MVGPAHVPWIILWLQLVARFAVPPDVSQLIARFLIYSDQVSLEELDLVLSLE